MTPPRRVGGFRVHDLKTHPGSWEDIDAGIKTVELRPADREYRAGDLLVLREFDPDQNTVDPVTQVETPGRFTGRVCDRWVTHVLFDATRYGLMQEFVALSISPLGKEV